jgi:dihydrolipoamide dehydrogenase (EC 1.8.1.4)
MEDYPRFDVIVIGAGPGGYIAAIRASQLGLKTAIIEKDATLGGTCLNVGCIPAKALLDTTELFSRIKEKATEHGILFDNLRFNLSTAMESKKKAVKKLTNGLALLMRANKIETFHGTGILVSSQRVKVAAPGREIMLQGKNIILATGSVPATLPSVPCDTEYIVHSNEALSLDSIPGSLVVVGAGTVGLEIGSIWMRLGAKVTVIECMDQVLPGMDTQVCRSLMQILKRQGMEFSLSTEITGYSIHGGTVELRGKNNNNEELSFSGDKVLIAVGRKAYHDGLGLENLNIELTAKGKIKVNERYQTTDPAVYAIGDIIEGPMLAHKAGEEGIAAAELIAGKAGLVNYETIPCIVYTCPEVASVGMTEDQCQSHNIPYSRGIFQFKANGRAITSDNLDGFVKIIAHKETDRIIGCSILGPWASDLIPEIVTVMEFGGSAEDISRTMHAHPTLSEAVKEAALDAAGRVIHSIPAAKTN